MFYPMAGSRLLVGTNTYAMKNVPFVFADFSADTFQPVREVEGWEALTTGSGAVEFNAIWPAFKRTVKGPRDFTGLKVTYAMDTADPAQLQLQLMEQSASDYAFRFDYNDATPTVVTGVPTISIAAPALVTMAGHGLQNGSAVRFTTAGALPTGIVAGTTYYVSVVSADTFNLAATRAAAILGTPLIATTGTSTGAHALTSIPQASQRFFIAKVMAIDDLNGATDGVIKRAATLAINCQPVILNGTN
jgi:hypothetical protein